MIRNVSYGFSLTREKLSQKNQKNSPFLKLGSTGVMAKVGKWWGWLVLPLDRRKNKRREKRQKAEWHFRNLKQKRG